MPSPATSTNIARGPSPSRSGDWWSIPVTRHAVLAMTDGNSSTPIITQALTYTDFPLDEITLWLVSDGDYRVLMLPSEY
jgi:hypothetical protein